MTFKTGHGVKQRHVLKFLMPVWFFLICVAVFAGFLHLDANSLWMDELFTVYFADPTQPDFAAFLARAAEDVHPPGYYAIVWTVGQFTSADITIVAKGAKIVIGAQTNTDENFFEPTVVTDVPLDTDLMQKEIFGPVLPIITYKNLHEAIDLINSKEKPLALYIYSKSA